MTQNVSLLTQQGNQRCLLNTIKSRRPSREFEAKKLGGMVSIHQPHFGFASTPASQLWVGYRGEALLVVGIS